MINDQWIVQLTPLFLFCFRHKLLWLLGGTGRSCRDCHPHGMARWIIQAIITCLVSLLRVPTGILDHCLKCQNLENKNHILSCHIISHHIIISYHMTSHHTTSYHIIYKHDTLIITSHHIASHRIVSYHISYHIIPYHMNMALWSFTAKYSAMALTG